MEKIKKSAKEWKALLSSEAYHITREAGTERAFSNEYWDYKGGGVFHCVCCGEPLFSADTKYDSGTGWPSFYQPITKEAISEQTDRRLFFRRVEVCCFRCDAHLGHVFKDGPEPTGLRYCINGLALTLKI